MKKTLLLFFALISINGFSQIYFATNASMYVKDQVLYVGQDINLQANSKLYLRNNSQLVQGTTGTSTNLGTGVISIFQEGTSDNFDYNYWCSPIGNASNGSGNENFGIAMLNSPTSSTASTPAVLLPWSSLDGVASPLSIASRWIYKLVNSNNYSQWVSVANSSTLAPGEGFTMKGTSGTDTTDPEGTGIQNNPGGTGAQRYDFRGKPNDGTISVTVGTNNATLTGNPYPSALHLNDFLLDPTNTAGTGIAYFWEQDKTVNSHYIAAYRGGYGSYSPINLGSNGIYVAATFNSYNGDGSLNATGTSSGLVIQRKYSPIGQGFLIYGTSNGTVSLKNSHRVYYKEGSPLTQFEKTAPHGMQTNTSVADASHFKLNTIINNQFTRQLALAFLPEATDAVDRGIDALNMDDSLPSDTYFFLDNNKYVIQGLPFDETKRISLGVKATAATALKFYIPEVINFNPSQSIYIYDALDDSYHDIRSGTYEVNVPPGTYNSRFKVVFVDPGTLSTVEESITSFVISQNNVNQTLTVSNPNTLALKSLLLYDISGKIILSKKDLGTDINYHFSTNGLSSGVYIVELQTIDNVRTTQKIIISNSVK